MRYYFMWGIFIFLDLFFFSTLVLSFISSGGTFCHFCCYHQTPQRFQQMRWIQWILQNLWSRFKVEKSKINPRESAATPIKLKNAKWETDRKYLLLCRSWTGLVIISYFNRLKKTPPFCELHLIQHYHCPSGYTRLDFMMQWLRDLLYFCYTSCPADSWSL